MAKMMNDEELVEALNVVIKELEAREEIDPEVKYLIRELEEYFADEIINVEEEE